MCVSVYRSWPIGFAKSAATWGLGGHLCNDCVTEIDVITKQLASIASIASVASISVEWFAFLFHHFASIPMWRQENSARMRQFSWFMVERFFLSHCCQVYFTLFSLSLSLSVSICQWMRGLSLNTTRKGNGNSSNVFSQTNSPNAAGNLLLCPWSMDAVCNWWNVRVVLQHFLLFLRMSWSRCEPLTPKRQKRRPIWGQNSSRLNRCGRDQRVPWRRYFPPLQSNQLNSKLISVVVELHFKQRSA